MLSVASLLNPEQPGVEARLPSSPSTTSSYGTPQLSSTQSHSYSSSSIGINFGAVKRQKMTKDGAVFAKGKIKGAVNYPPFELFDESTLRETQKFQVYPLGKITEYCRHIPYNSEKKSFLEKTGRESFEVFQYTFKLPGDDKVYTVMWDYNIGLVRITPFFKCLKYTKTTPAKMLNVNPGLKNITHSITGGALVAQGYWMPYNCALAVCTTFCHDIAAALIPLFGPTFPSLCVPPEAPEYNRWTIDPTLIIAATVQAETYRLSSPSSLSKISASPSPSPFSRTKLPHTGPLRRMGLKRGFGLIEDTDNEEGDSETSGGDAAYFCSPGPVYTSVFRDIAAHAANSSYHVAPSFHPSAKLSNPSPWLSAIPRSVGLPPSLPPSLGYNRCIDDSYCQPHYQAVADEEYDGEESTSMSVSVSENDMDAKGDGDKDTEMVDGIGGAEKKAAKLLIKLSMRDGAGEATVTEGDGPRVKRRRATSL